MPAATPPIQPASRSRRRTRADALPGLVVTRRSSPPGHPGRQQDRSGGGAADRGRGRRSGDRACRSASSRSSTPSASTAMPATSEVGSGLRDTGRVASELVDARAEVEMRRPREARSARRGRSAATRCRRRPSTSSRVVSAAASGRSSTSTSTPSLWRLERARLADADLRVGGHADVVRDDHAARRRCRGRSSRGTSPRGRSVCRRSTISWPIPSWYVSRRSAADGGPVVAVARRRRRGRCPPPDTVPADSASATAGQHQPADRAQERADQDRHAGGDDHDRHDRLAACGRRPGAADGDQSAEDEDADAERGSLGDVARVVRRVPLRRRTTRPEHPRRPEWRAERGCPRGRVRRREERAR